MNGVGYQWKTDRNLPEEPRRFSLDSGQTAALAAGATRTDTTVLQPTLSTDAARRIALLKQRKVSSPPASEGFDYDPNEPLRLLKPGKSEMHS